LTAAGASAIPIGLASDAGELKLQNTLFYLLATLMTGRGLVEIKQVVGNNELEAWRRISARFEPKSRNRQLALLDAAMRPSLTGSEESVRDRVVEWEATLSKYTAVSGRTCPMT
jgi:hypothetical protein